MVFFTCNACGSSLKKNQVEKHYQSECPRCEVLSCMDCGRDFHGDEYAGHTKCISEAEKYQGGLFRESGKTGAAGKGEKKQQEWLERVQDLAAQGTKVNPRISRLLERISQYPNIPRKKTKFENFVKNSVNVHDQKTLGELWDLFSTAIKPVAQESEGGSTPTAVRIEVAEISEEENGESPPKLKKEKKKKVMETCDASDVVPEQGKAKKKKKKHKKEDATADTARIEEDIINDPPNEEGRVSKKNKKRRENDTAEEHTMTEPDEENPNFDLLTAKKKKKKKKKSKDHQVDGSAEMERETAEDAVGVGPMEVAVEYINGRHNEENADNFVADVDSQESKPKKAKKKRRSEREAITAEETPTPKKQKKHKQ